MSNLKSGGNKVDNISEVYKRASLQKISGFILHGVEDIYEFSDTYEKEIKKTIKEMNNAFRKYFEDEKLITNIMDDIFSFIFVYKKVYFEVGMQCGLLLAKDLIISNE